jgi:hypothetical protein
VLRDLDGMEEGGWIGDSNPALQCRKFRFPKDFYIALKVPTEPLRDLRYKCATYSALDGKSI